MADKPTAPATAAGPNTELSKMDIESILLARSKQLENAYNVAIAAKDKPKAEQIVKDMVFLSSQAAVLTEGNKVLSEMVKVIPNLRKALAEKMQEGGDKAFLEMLTLQAEANKKKQTMAQDEIDRMYQSRLATAEGPARLLASFKGFALLLQAFGVDCSEFIAECDKKIEAEYAKIPKKNIDRLTKLDAYTIDPTEPLVALTMMNARAEQTATGLGQVVGTSTQGAINGAQQMTGGGNVSIAPAQTPAPAADTPVSTGHVITAMEQIIAEKKMITGKGNDGLKADLEKGLTAAAGVDGDAKTMSAKDVDVLALTTGAIIRTHGGKVDADEATKIAKQAIERARMSSALAGIPVPQPS